MAQDHVLDLEPFPGSTWLHVGVRSSCNYVYNTAAEPLCPPDLTLLRPRHGFIHLSGGTLDNNQLNIYHDKCYVWVYIMLESKMYPLFQFASSYVGVLVPCRYVHAIMLSKPAPAVCVTASVSSHILLALCRKQFATLT